VSGTNKKLEILGEKIELTNGLEDLYAYESQLLEILQKYVV